MMNKEQFEALRAMIAAMIAYEFSKSSAGETNKAVNAASAVLVVDEPIEIIGQSTDEPKERIVLPAQLAKDACPVCGGSGSLGSARCHTCKGTGKKSR